MALGTIRGHDKYIIDIGLWIKIKYRPLYPHCLHCKRSDIFVIEGQPLGKPNFDIFVDNSVLPRAGVLCFASVNCFDKVFVPVLACSINRKWIGLVWLFGRVMDFRWLGSRSRIGLGRVSWHFKVQWWGSSAHGYWDIGPIYKCSVITSPRYSEFSSEAHLANLQRSADVWSQPKYWVCYRIDTRTTIARAAMTIKARRNTNAEDPRAWKKQPIISRAPIARPGKITSNKPAETSNKTVLTIQKSPPDER